MSNIYLYLFIPIASLFLLIKIIFRGDCQSTKNIYLYCGKLKLTIFILIYCILITSLKWLKLYYLNYPLFDAGLYLNKLSIISEAEFYEKLAVALIQGHFQPIMLFYALIFKYTPLPQYAVFFLETCTLAFAAFPVYLLTQMATKDRCTSLLVAGTFLIYPLLSFNDLLGFHPDHVVLPCLLFAFYFSETRRYLLATIFLIIISITSEPWIPIVAFFGIYILIKEKKIYFGLLLFGISLVFFIFIYFYLLKLPGSGNASYFLSSQSSPYINLINLDILGVLRSFNLKKIFYVYIIFMPLLFLPLIRPIYLIVAIPDFCKALLSTEPLHYAPEGHYTLGIIACIFMSLISAIKYLGAKFSKDFAKKISILLLLNTFIFSVLHSVFPWSIDFWTGRYKKDFNYVNYTSPEKRNNFNFAINLVNSLPNNTKIEISNNAFFPDLATKKIEIFPGENWHKANYLILDIQKNQTSGSMLNEETFRDSYRTAYSEIYKFFRICKESSHYTIFININNNENVKCEK